METAKDFLNPSSMMTPGAAGALTMTVANTVTLQFGLAESWSAIIALSLSFLFGLLVLTAEALPVWRKLAYYIINSLIIFTVAVGSNTLGGTASASPRIKNTDQSFHQQHFFIDLATPRSAHAQPPENGWCCLNDRVNQSSFQECNKWGGQFFPSEKDALRACQTKVPKAELKVEPKATPKAVPDVPKERFFRPWF